ncbi:MAG: flagellar motor protein MotB [Acetobacteraceae bacterium]
MRAKGRKQGNEKAGIVIRKEEIVVAGAHGGAWKVAYADFVTAMMAFFLLMWLINATTEAQRKGLANYFAPTSVLSFRYSGSGKPFGGKTAFSEGQMVSDLGAVQVITGKEQPEPNAKPDARTPRPGTLAPDHGTARKVETGPAAPFTPTAGGVGGPDVGAPALPLAAGKGAGPAPRDAAAKEAARQQAAFARAAGQIRSAIRADAGLKAIARQIAIDVTPKGLRIQILDGRKRPMFALGSAALAPAAQHFLARLAPILGRLSGPIAISGYTDAAPYQATGQGSGQGTGMTNWELSTERANAARSLLVANGLARGRIASVSGYADRDLLLPAQPLAAQNRRVAILVERVTAPPPAVPTGPTAPASPAIR